MARFSEEWLSELLSKNNIVDVVAGYLPLQKKGGSYWSKCPWHPDSNPSFCVTPARDMFYCFSCKRGGSVVNFIMEQERLSYMEAIALLAARVGMEVPEPKDDGEYRKKKEAAKKLVEINREAARYFHEKLKTPEGKKALDYLIKRGVQSQIVPFGLGYSSESYDDLTKHLTGKGFELKDIIDAGLAKKNERGYYDTFRGRVMYPIINISGEVIAFGGRIMDKGEPKYLNSPDTFIFNKRKNLYALNTVRKKRGLKSILLVEGYMDVIGLAANGVDTAVASLGTSFTKEQARLLKRFTDKVYLSYDGDEPGINAALKAVDILAAEGLKVYVITLPDGRDPDEYIRARGRDAFYEEAKHAKPRMLFKLSRIKKDFDVTDPDDAVAYCTRAVEELKTLDNELERERYVRLLASETGMSENSINARLSGERAPAERYNIPEKEKNSKTKQEDREASLIANIMSSPELTDRLADVEREDFEDRGYAEMFFYAASQIKKGFSVSGAELLSRFEESGELKKDSVERLMTATEVGQGPQKEEYVRGLVLKMKKARLTREKERLISETASADADRKKVILEEIERITRKIRALSGK